MLISKFLFSKRLNSKIIYLFNVENYGKPLNPLNISRLHSRFRYDENAQIKEDKNLAQEFLTKEKNLFDSILPKITEVNKYFKTSEQRKDTRIMELPERYENYDYFSKFAHTQTQNN